MRRSDRGTQAKVAYSSFAFNQKSQKPRPEELSNNLTEELVQIEMERQLATLSNNVAQFVTRADVMAYALNRLPAFYASTNRGRKKQQEYVFDRFYPEIEMFVRQGIAAVTADPLRTKSDAWQPLERSKHEEVLNQLRTCLKFDCCWDNLVKVVQYRLIQANRGEFYLDPSETTNWEKHPLHQE